MSKKLPFNMLNLHNLFAALLSFSLASCSIGECSKYASDYSCGYVVDEALYQVWYWKNVEEDRESDTVFIGEATGLRMCEANARAFASAIGDDFGYRSYICILMDEGRKMEKHRLMGDE